MAGSRRRTLGSRGFIHQAGDRAPNIEQVMVVAAAAGTVGPFVTACCTELGKRFGGTVADWTSRVRRNADIPVEVDGVVTVLQIEENLPDEARLTLLDLDFNDPVVRGCRLRWNTEAQAWVPIDHQD